MVRGWWISQFICLLVGSLDVWLVFWSFGWSAARWGGQVALGCVLVSGHQYITLLQIISKVIDINSFFEFFFRENIRDLRYLSILNLKNIRSLSLNTMWLMDMVDHELWWDRLIKFPQASSRWKQHQSLWSIFVGKVKHRRPKLKLEKSCSQPDWSLPMDSAELWCSL